MKRGSDIDRPVLALTGVQRLMLQYEQYVTVSCQSSIRADLQPRSTVLVQTVYVQKPDKCQKTQRYSS